jgi:hypothetical protein
LTIDRGIFVAADAKKYSASVASEHGPIQEDLRNALTQAATAARLPYERWVVQPQGDGVLILTPLDHEPRYIDDFIGHLQAALRRRNRDRVPDARLRLRVGLAQGPTRLVANGFEGEAAILACRLRDAQATRTALDDSDSDIVLAVSEGMFADNVRDDRTRLVPEDFTHVVINEEKVNTAAWIWLPCGFRSQTLDEARAHKSVTPGGGRGSGVTIHQHLGDGSSATTVTSPVTAETVYFGTVNKGTDDE